MTKWRRRRRRRRYDVMLYVFGRLGADDGCLCRCQVLWTGLMRIASATLATKRLAFLWVCVRSHDRPQSQDVRCLGCCMVL